MYRIIYTRADGGVAVVVPANGKTPEEVVRRAVPNGCDFTVVPVEQIPTDRYFRNAWEKVGGSVAVNMEKARAVQMGKIRAVRDQELARLDIEQLKGLDVAAQKTALRDLPATFDLTQAQTPEELKALWPKVLPR